jgi:hypothetical protein
VKSAERFSLRRLAAIDLHGRTGTARRRRIVLAEFTIASILGMAVGAVLVAVGAPLAIIRGGYMIGIGVNYLALLIASWQLLRSNRLESELSGFDIDEEVRRYSISQARILIPFLLAVSLFSSESRT